MPAPNYTVTLRHLAPDASAAGLAYPNEQPRTVSAGQLRDMFEALRGVAEKLTIYEPSTPEIRVKTERDIFLVRTRYRRLCLVGWETMLRGEEHSVSFIMTTITGTTEAIKVSPRITERYVRPPSAPGAAVSGGSARWVKIAVLLLIILGFNGYTVWRLVRPPPSVVPKHELLDESESRALLERLAGEFETGSTPGQRRLVIMPDGAINMAKLGAHNTLLEERHKTARGALIDGRQVLVFHDGVIDIKNNDTLVMFGSTYHRGGG